jgi:hypothetical protein
VIDEADPPIVLELPSWQRETLINLERLAQTAEGAAQIRQQGERLRAKPRREAEPVRILDGCGALPFDW